MQKADLEYVAEVAGVDITTEPQSGLEIGMIFKRATAGGWGEWAGSRECEIVGFVNKKLEDYANAGRLEWAEKMWQLGLQDNPEREHEIVVVFKEVRRDAYDFAPIDKIRRAIEKDQAYA